MIKKDLDKILSIALERLTLAKVLKKTAWEIGENTLDGDCFLDIPERNDALLRGKYWDVVIRTINDSLIRRSSNLILPKLSAKLALLDQGATEFFLEPTMTIYTDVADKAEGLLNYTWEDKQCDRVLARLQLDAEKYGFGVAEIDWRFEQDGVVSEGERGEPAPVTEDSIPISPDVLASYDANPEFTAYETEAEAEAMALAMTKQGEDIIWNTTYDDVFVSRVSPRNFWIDPAASSWDLSDAQFVIKLEYVPLNKVKFNKKYSKARKDVVGGVYSVAADLREGETITRDNRSDCALVKVYHIYGYFDVKDNGEDEKLHVVFTPECKEPLLVEEILYKFGPSSTIFPFRILPGIVVDNENPYPISSIDQASDLQITYDEAFSQISNIRRKALRMYMVPKGSLDKDAIEKFEMGIDGSMIEVEPALISGIQPFPHISIPMEYYRDLAEAPNEVQRALGVSEFTEGITPRKNMTATESVAIQSSGNSRINGCYENQRDCKQDLAYCLLCLYQQFADREFVFSKKDNQGNRQFDTANATTLRGLNTLTGDLEPVGIQFKVKINVDSVNPTNRAAKISEQLGLLTQLNPYIEAGLINPVPIIRTLLKTAQVDNLDEALSTQPGVPEQLSNEVLPGQPTTEQPDIQEEIPFGNESGLNPMGP